MSFLACFYLLSLHPFPYICATLFEHICVSEFRYRNGYSLPALDIGIWYTRMLLGRGPVLPNVIQNYCRNSLYLKVDWWIEIKVIPGVLPTCTKPVNVGDRLALRNFQVRSHVRSEWGHLLWCLMKRRVSRYQHVQTPSNYLSGHVNPIARQIVCPCPIFPHFPVVVQISQTVSITGPAY